MRVIAGEAGGRKLKSGKGQKARPTTDRVKESLFNILGTLVYDTEWLDLFAGFGGIGIEALSRGATRVVFVEEDPKHVEIIKENLEMVRYTDRSQVLRGDALKILPTLNQSFDLIYIDPPYETGLYEKVLELIHQRGILRSDGIIILEHSKGLPPQLPDYYEVRKYKEYGESGLTFVGVKG